MKHYDYIEWLFYKKKMISIEKQNEMEEHLFNCDECMEIFLSLIDEEEVNEASKIIPENFNKKIIKKISESKVKKMELANKPVKYPFGYFVAVASVTIVLTLGGAFTNLVDTVPNISASVSMLEKPQRPNRIFDISEKIVSSTSKFIVSIENIERNKEEK